MTSLKRALRRNTSRKRSVWRSARRTWECFQIMIAHEVREKPIKIARISFAIGPDWTKNSKMPGPVGPAGPAPGGAAWSCAMGEARMGRKKPLMPGEP